MFFSALTIGKPDWLGPGLAILGLALVLLIIRYGPRRGSMPGGARFLALSLKLAGVALLLACLVDVRWTESRPQEGANLFLVLADTSRGMNVSDGGDESRGELLAAALHRPGMGGDVSAVSADTDTAWQESLEGTFQVRRYTFGERLASVPDYEDLTFDGATSDLGHALEVLGERYRSRPVAGLLLFTDGNATDLEAMTDMESDSEEPTLPVFPVLIGDESAPLRDLAIRDTRVSQTAFEDAPVTIEVDVRSAGFEGSGILLECLDEEGVVVEKTVREVAADNEDHRFRLQLKPLETGALFYRLRLSPAGESGTADTPDEATMDNNERVVLVDRDAGPYRILYVSGRPNWEYKFLRRALEPDPQIDMTGLLRVAKREPKFQWRGRAGESSNPLFRGFGREDAEDEAGYDKPVLIRLNTRDERELSGGFPILAADLFSQYHAIVVDDLEAGFFTRDQMDLIEDFVSRRGGGFLMLGGQESFREGGYSDTPIAKLLPVYLDRVGEAAAPGQLRLDFTREGWLEPWLRLRELEAKEKERIGGMPEFLVLNQLRAIKPGASILATVGDGVSRSFPAIVGQRYGEGRVLAVPVGDVWRWGFKDAELHDDMAKSWRQAVRWLIADIPKQIAFSVETGKSGGRRLDLQVRVRDEEFEPLDNASVTITVTGESEKEIELLAEPSMDEAGLYEVAWSGRREGQYRAVAVVKDEDGKVLGQPETGWTVDLGADEYRNLRPNRSLLETIAERSGGEMVALEELDAFATDRPNREAPMMQVSSEPLWHAPWVFLAALVCFGAEWSLRRRWGLA